MHIAPSAPRGARFISGAAEARGAMSSETLEFLKGLYRYDAEDGEGPYVNWVNGFEANPDEYERYMAQLLRAALQSPPRRASRRDPVRDLVPTSA
jgi:hypothetical protein